MSFAGHVLDMLKRQKMNRSLQKKNRFRYVEKGNDYSSNKKEFNVEKYPKLSKAERVENQKKIRSKLRKEEKAIWLKTLITAIAISFIIFVLIKLLR